MIYYSGSWQPAIVDGTNTFVGVNSTSYIWTGTNSVSYANGNFSYSNGPLDYYYSPYGFYTLNTTGSGSN